MFNSPPPTYNDTVVPSPGYSSGAQVFQHSETSQSQKPIISVQLDAPGMAHGFGDFINGKIFITPKKDMKVKSIQAVLEGEEVASSSRWTKYSTSDNTARIEFKVAKFTIPLSSLPQNAILRRKFTYVYPFSIQTPSQRATQPCPCRNSHASIPPSFSHAIASKSGLGVGVGSGIKNKQNTQHLSHKNFLLPSGNPPTFSHAISSRAKVNVSVGSGRNLKPSPQRLTHDPRPPASGNPLHSLSYNTQGPLIGVSYRVSAYVKQAGEKRDLVFRNDFLHDVDHATVKLISTYLPNPSEEARYTVGQNKLCAANERVRLDIMPGTKLIMSMDPKELLAVNMQMQFSSFEASQSARRIAPSPKNISGKLICRTLYSTKQSSGAFAATEPPADFEVNLDPKWLSVNDPNERNCTNQSFTELTAGFSIPESVVATHMVVPSFQSCLIKREYWLKMRVRTTDSANPLQLIIPVYVVASLSTPLPAYSSSHFNIQDCYTMMSEKPSYSSLSSSRESTPQLSRSSSVSSSSSSIRTPSGSPSSSPIRNVLRAIRSK